METSELWGEGGDIEGETENSLWIYDCIISVARYYKVGAVIKICFICTLFLFQVVSRDVDKTNYFYLKLFFKLFLFYNTNFLDSCWFSKRPWYLCRNVELCISQLNEFSVNRYL